MYVLVVAIYFLDIFINGFEFTEIKKCIDGQPYDQTGILVSIFTTSTIILGIVFAPLGVYLELDPIYLIVETNFPYLLTNWWTKWTLICFRYIWHQWCTLEVSRLSLITCVPLIFISNSYLNIVHSLQKKSFGNRVIESYTHFRCVHQIGLETGACIIGIQMSFGFLILVICNGVIIRGWHIFPATFYFFIVALDINVTFIVFQTLPVAIIVWNICSGMIVSWKRSTCKISENRLYWRKALRAQPPVAFHYATAKFDADTKRNYYANIFESTINLILLY